jgi:hypothetical protein
MFAPGWSHKARPADETCCALPGLAYVSSVCRWSATCSRACVKIAEKVAISVFADNLRTVAGGNLPVRVVMGWTWHVFALA